MTAVLVVEDDPALARVVCRDLQDGGFAVLVADSVPRASAILRSRPVDVLLTDLRLEGPDGLELVRLSREISPSTRAILMSGFASARDSELALGLGAVRVICKPFTRAELLEAIAHAVECRSGFHGSVHGLSLVDVLQMYHFGRRSVTIAVGGKEGGRVDLREGEIVHAQHRALVGEAALTAVLSLHGGSFMTGALRDGGPATITRDFSEVLFDALRAVDETAPDSELDDALGLVGVGDEIFESNGTRHGGSGGNGSNGAHSANLHRVAAASVGVDRRTEATRARALLARLRAVDGYLAACVAHVDDGDVVAHEGVIDLRPATDSLALLVRQSEASSASVGSAATEDVLVTLTTQHHILRAIDSNPRVFVYLVLDRRTTNFAMAKLALSAAVSAYAP